MKAWVLKNRVEDLSEKLTDTPEERGARIDFSSFSEPEKALIRKIWDLQEEYGENLPLGVLEANKELVFKANEILFKYVMNTLKFTMLCFMGDPESVKKYLVTLSIAESSKHSYCVAYTSFLKWQGKTWTMPKYKGTQKIPEFIPTEQEIDALIAGCGKKTATILQTLKETAMRIGECLSLTWTAVSPEAHTITLNTPEKNSLPRLFKVSPKLIMMIQAMPKKSNKIFPSSSRSVSVCLRQQRKKIAQKLANPHIERIHFHLLRHWKATMEYHKTQNIVQVQHLLGHKSILNTQIYINLEQALFEVNDEYDVKLASTIEEACKLVEVGFEYITEMDGKKLFRKRK